VRSTYSKLLKFKSSAWNGSGVEQGCSEGTYRGTKQLAFVHKLEKKGHVFGGEVVETVELIITCLFQTATGDCGGALGRSQDSFWEGDEGETRACKGLRTPSAFLEIELVDLSIMTAHPAVEGGGEICDCCM
jgi:hypothetical protein